MKRLLPISLLALGLTLGLSSCAKDEGRKPVGPESTTSKIPWNQPIPGQGQGHFGMLPQNTYRR